MKLLHDSQPTIRPVTREVLAKVEPGSLAAVLIELLLRHKEQEAKR
jgi:hypothetical protein